MSDETFIVAIDADTQGFESALKSLEKQANNFGTTITGAFKSAIVSGKSFEDTLRSIGLSLAGSALNAGLAPLQNILNSFGANLFKGFGSVTPFANGGVVGSPTYFPNGNSIGLMGEAGSEAILPLRRGADGRLGVAAGGNSNGASNVTINISTPDSQSFQRSSGQISAALTRAVARGRRGN
ncbi:MAG: phage tail tape measure protein [Ahrensia sp.]|nr:phage tail tape measure protein [Ahrensia sp.]